jgi:hypothetical protein
MRRSRTVAFRRGPWLAAGVMLVAVLSAGCGSRPSPSAPKRPSAHAPLVNASAFAGHGELAFISRGTLWVLDGEAGTLRRVSAPGITPLSPEFSPDGRWLAFLGTSDNPPVQTRTVWLARGDGSGARRIVTSSGLIGWSPVSDVLAVEAGNAIRLIRPPGPARTLSRLAGLWGAVWSPDGRDLAVATRDWRSATTLASYPVAGGKPTVWLRLNARSGLLNGMNEVIISPAGWWPRWGIGFWVFGNGMVHNNDQTPLDAIPAPGKPVRLLGYTLSDGYAPQAAAAPSGWLAIVNNPDLRDVGRIIWEDKRVEVCHPGLGSCVAVPSPRSAVTLDPAWSPDSSELAYVRAPYRVSAGYPQAVTVAWYAAHQLWLYHPATGSRRELDAAGASVPVWSADGKSLLYVAQDGIWLLPQLHGRPVRIAGPLFAPGHWPLSYYGQVDWTGQFAWWAGNLTAPPTQISTTPTPARSAAAARLAGNGIGPSRFGQPERQVLAALDTILGRPARSYRASGYGCGVDHEIDWPGLEAYFGRGRFTGYSYRGAYLKTAAGLQVGDSIRQARQRYGKALRLSFEQDGAWFARTPLGSLDGFTYGRSGNRTDIGPDSRVETIEAGTVGCAALSP